MLVELDVFGDTQLKRRLLRFADGATDASPAFQTIADDLRDLERRQFASQGSSASAGWAPLAPSTVTRKARLGLDPRILHATGRLRASLEGHGAGHLEIVQPHQLVFGTTVPYARHHQHGTEIMPRRRPIELREQDRRQVVRTLQRHLMGER